MKDFVIDLDHIEKGIKDWEKFANSMDGVIDEGLKELYELTDKHVDLEASKYGLSSSNLHKTKSISLSNDVFSINYTAPHAVYVEFGTGIMGSKSPHPDPSEWDAFKGYDVNNHGYDGWFYYDKNKKLHWTAGTKARPVMYNTKVWVNTQATKIIRKHIRKRIEELTR